MLWFIRSETVLLLHVRLIFNGSDWETIVFWQLEIIKQDDKMELQKYPRRFSCPNYTVLYIILFCNFKIAISSIEINWKFYQTKIRSRGKCVVQKSESCRFVRKEKQWKCVHACVNYNVLSDKKAHTLKWWEIELFNSIFQVNFC